MSTPHRLFRTLLQICAVPLLLGLAHAAALAQTVNWVSWTAPSAPQYPNSYAPQGYTYRDGVSGSLLLADNATVVNTTLTGEVINFSCFGNTISDCPPGYWRNEGGWSGSAPANTFTSTNVPALPTNANMLAMAGYVPAVARHTLTFDRPVTNIVMTIFSLGGTPGNSAYKFDQDFTLLSQDTRCTGHLTDAAPLFRCMTVHGRTLTGREGMGTLQFTGTFTSISWEVTVPEVYSGFNIGVTSASFTAQSALTLTASASHIPVASGTSVLSTSGGSGAGAVSYTVVSGPCTVSGNTLTGTSAGTCRVTATKAGDGTHASATSNTVTVTVVRPLSVTYDGNGQTYGAAPVDSGAYDNGNSVTVLGQNFLQRSGYSFGGWNTAADGSGTTYAAAATFAITASTTLYARWLNTTYHVTYDANSATTGTAPAAQTKNDGTPLTLATNTGGLARTGYAFAGWNTAADGSGTNYAAGATYTDNAALALYARWTINTYSVTYDGNGATSGTAPLAQDKTHGTPLTLATNAGNLARAGYAFAGWNTAADGSGTDYAAGGAYAADAAGTLYAKWLAAAPAPIPTLSQWGLALLPLLLAAVAGLRTTRRGA